MLDIANENSGHPLFYPPFTKKHYPRLLQQEYPELQKRYWGKHFWAIGYGAWSTGNLSEQLVEEYLEHHRSPSNQERDNFLLE